MREADKKGRQRLEDRDLSRKRLNAAEMFPYVAALCLPNLNLGFKCWKKL